MNSAITFTDNGEVFTSKTEPGDAFNIYFNNVIREPNLLQLIKLCFVILLKNLIMYLGLTKIPKTTRYFRIENSFYDPRIFLFQALSCLSCDTHHAYMLSKIVKMNSRRNRPEVFYKKYVLKSFT